MILNPTKIMSEADCQRVHDASLQILRDTGVVFHSEEALAIFKKHGARVEGEIVYLDEKMVQEALAGCPEKFTWRGRNDKYSVTVGDGILVQPNVGPVYIEDMDQGRRMGTLADYANIMKLCQASDVVDLNGSLPVNPSDVDTSKKHLSIMYEILKNTDKPIIGSCATQAEAAKMLDMVEVAFGQKDFLRDNHCVGVLVNPLSPLAYAPETLETIIEYTKRNQVSLLAPCIMAGITGPISHLGTAVLQNVELLAGITLIQLINPGLPVVYATASTVGYMKTASFAAGTPEAMLTNMPNLQMGLDFYHLPTRTMCGINHSKVVDAQAGYETMMSLMMGLMSGAHIFVQCLGVLDAIMTTSYEKLIMDTELISRVKRIRQGIDTSSEALSTEMIQEVGHNGTYLTHPSTFAQFRNLWMPTVSNWDSYQDWSAGGSEDVVKRANKKYKEILQNAPETLLDPETDKALRAFIG